MEKKAASGIMLTLLLIGTLTIAFNITSVSAEYTYVDLYYLATHPEEFLNQQVMTEGIVKYYPFEGYDVFLEAAGFPGVGMYLWVSPIPPEDSRIQVYGTVLYSWILWDNFINVDFWEFAAPPVAEISIPEIIDPDLVPASPTIFTIPVTIDDVIKLWGYEFVLYYDINVLTAIDLRPLPPLDNIIWAWEINDAEGYVSLATSSYLGDPNGLTTFDPTPVAEVDFLVDALGFSRLEFSSIPCQNPKLTNVYGESLSVVARNGRFANTMDLLVAVDTAFLETRKFSLTKDPEGLLTMTAQIKSKGSGWTKARARFTVLDRDGMFVGVLLSDEVSVAPEPPEPESSMYRLSVDLDATKLPRPKVYTVEVEVQYLNAYGEWIIAQKGMEPGGYKWMVIKSFSVED